MQKLQFIIQKAMFTNIGANILEVLNVVTHREELSCLQCTYDDTLASLGLGTCMCSQCMASGNEQLWEHLKGMPCHSHPVVSKW